MNNDLISRKYVIAELLKEREQFPPMVAERYSLGVKLPHRFNQAMRGGIRKGLRIVETAPAADAVEVVRCKDCKHWIVDGYWNGNPDQVRACRIAGWICGANGYCVHGERNMDAEVG